MGFQGLNFGFSGGNSGGGGGSGTVTDFTFTNANGFTGVVTNPTTTPNLTLSQDNSYLPPIQRDVYLVNDTSDAVRMGGAANQVYSDFQSAYDAANTIQLSLGAGNFVALNVDTTVAATVGNLTLSTDFNQYIVVVGKAPNASQLGNIILDNVSGDAHGIPFALFVDCIVGSISMVGAGAGGNASIILLNTITDTVTATGGTGDGGFVNIEAIGMNSGTGSIDTSSTSTNGGGTSIKNAVVGNITTQCGTTPGSTSGSIEIDIGSTTQTLDASTSNAGCEGGAILIQFSIITGDIDSSGVGDAVNGAITVNNRSFVDGMIRQNTGSTTTRGSTLTIQGNCTIGGIERKNLGTFADMESMNVFDCSCNGDINLVENNAAGKGLGNVTISRVVMGSGYNILYSTLNAASNAGTINISNISYSDSVSLGQYQQTLSSTANSADINIFDSDFDQIGVTFSGAISSNVPTLNITGCKVISGINVNSANNYTGNLFGTSLGLKDNQCPAINITTGTQTNLASLQIYLINITPVADANITNTDLQITDNSSAGGGINLFIFDCQKLGIDYNSSNSHISDVYSTIYNSTINYGLQNGIFDCNNFVLSVCENSNITLATDTTNHTPTAIQINASNSDISLPIGFEIPYVTVEANQCNFPQGINFLDALSILSNCSLGIDLFIPTCITDINGDGAQFSNCVFHATQFSITAAFPVYIIAENCTFKKFYDSINIIPIGYSPEVFPKFNNLGNLITVGNTTTQTSLLTTVLNNTGSNVIKGNTVSDKGIEGISWRIRGSFKYTTKAVTPGTLSINVALVGQGTSGTGAISLVHVGGTSWMNIDAIVTVIIGTGGGNGAVSVIGTASSNDGTYLTKLITTTALNLIDWTSDIPLDVQAKWSVADVANTLTTGQMIIEEIRVNSNL